MTASLVLRLDPAAVPDFGSDWHSTWAGSLTLAGGYKVDLFDAAPGFLRLPDGRVGRFMASSGPRRECGRSGLGPAPFGQA